MTPERSDPSSPTGLGSAAPDPADERPATGTGERPDAVADERPAPEAEQGSVTAPADGRYLTTFLLFFMIMVPLGCSDDIARILHLTGLETRLDGVLLSIANAVLLATGRRDCSERRRRKLTWSISGSVILLLIDIGYPLLGESLVAEFVVQLAYVLPMLMLVVAAVSPDILAVDPRDHRLRIDHANLADLKHCIPLFVGLVAEWFAEIYWRHVVVAEPGGVADHEFYFQIGETIPLLLVAVGIEAGVFARSAVNPIRRAVTQLTVGILSLGELAALFVLLLPPERYEKDHRLVDALQYPAFMLGIYAAVTAVSLLVANVMSRREDGAPTPAR